ncbi:MAG TPA: HEAT repeat domain-containing protein [Verrucomicrobiae bacterium]|nr:HEAT repeat domain-containing protein [Verrucomicrobiae bacterium]
MINTRFWLVKQQLSSKLPQKRMKGVQSLRGVNDPEAMALLLSALKDREAAVRSEVVNALGGFNNATVVRALIGALRDHAETVQALAIQALKKIGDASAIEPVASVLLRGSPKVQMQAAHALRSWDWSPQTMDEQIAYYVALGDFKRVLVFGPPAINALVTVLCGGTEERRAAVANLLGETGDPTAAKPLIAALKDSAPTVRAAAAGALSRLGDRQLWSSLVPLLKDKTCNVRVAAVAAIGRLGDAQAWEVLANLATDREWEVRMTLAEALARLKDERALPTVLQLLKDADQEVRQSAAGALGDMGNENHIEPLVMAMVDEHMGVRQAAARSLAMIEPYWEKSPRVRAFVPKLQEAVSDHDPGVQAAAALLVRRLTGRSAAEILASETKPVSPRNEELMELFRQFMTDQDECVRLAAAEALGRLKLPIAIQTLQNALRDPSKWVKQAAEHSLQEITRKMRY